MRHLLVALAIFSQLATPQENQPATKSTFDAFSIKPHETVPDNGPNFRLRNGRLFAMNVSLHQVLVVAFSLKSYQIGTGWPPWLKDERFDLQGVAEGNQSRDEMYPMLQKALAERCRLQWHSSNSTVNGFALVVANHGPKLKPSTAAKSEISTDEVQLPGQTVVSFKIKATKTTMHGFAEYLSKSVLDQPVTDATNLPGEFDFELSYAPSEDPDAGPAIFTTIKEQLGLRLEPRKVEITKMNIDNIQRPSPN